MVTAAVPKGRFVWYELMTSDPDGAKAFYQKVLGWGASPWEGGEKPYTMWMNGEKALGGVLELPEPARKAGAPPHWLAYIATPDLGATVARARELGANILEPLIEIPTVGKIAILADPQGAVFAAYTPEERVPDQEGGPNDGDVSWHELATTDTKAAFRFYSDLFGWETTSEMDMGEFGVYHMYGQHGVPYGGIYDKPPDMPAPPHWLLYVRVSDIDAALERVKQNGGQVLNGPMEVPGGDMVAQCMDPQGAAFALHMPKKG